MSSKIKTIIITFVISTLVGCGGGGGGTGSARIITIPVDHFVGLSATPITGADNIKSTAQISPTTSVSSPQANQIMLGTTTYNFADSTASNFVFNSFSTLAVANSDVLNLGYSYARFTVLARGRGFNTNFPNVDEVIFVQTSTNPTPTSNLPTQALVRYTGDVITLNNFGASMLFSGEVSISEFIGSFSVTTDFANNAGQITGTVSHRDGTRAGTIRGNRGTGDNANKFTLTYTGNGISNGVAMATANGGFYGPNAEEVSGIGTGITTTGALPVVVGFVGRRQ